MIIYLSYKKFISNNIKANSINKNLFPDSNLCNLNWDK